MKKLKLLLIFMIAGLSANAQNIPQKIFERDNQGMVLILNNDIIGSIDLLEHFPTNRSN